MITVLPIGCKVELGTGEKIQGVITSIQITANERIVYQVAWWNGRSHEEKPLEQFEVVNLDARTTPLAIGFTR